MKRIAVEKSIVFILFVLVLIIFSFAERDTQKMFRQYNVPSSAAAGSQPSPVAVTLSR